MTIAQFSREDIIRVSSWEEGCEKGKRDMALLLYRQGVEENVIAAAAGEKIEVVRKWIKEDSV